MKWQFIVKTRIRIWAFSTLPVYKVLEWLNLHAELPFYKLQELPFYKDLILELPFYKKGRGDWVVGSVVGWLFSDKKSGNPKIHPEIQWFILIVFIKTVTCAMVKTCFIVTGDGQKSIRGSCVQGKDGGMIMPHIQVPCFDHRPSSASLGPPCEAPVARVRLRSCSRRAPSRQGDGWSNDLTKWPHADGVDIVREIIPNGFFFSFGNCLYWL